MVKQQPPKPQPKKKTVEIPRDSGEIIVFEDPTKRRANPVKKIEDSGSRAGKVIPSAGKKPQPSSGTSGGSSSSARLSAEEAALEESSRKITERLLKEVEEFSQSFSFSFLPCCDWIVEITMALPERRCLASGGERPEEAPETEDAGAGSLGKPVFSFLSLFESLLKLLSCLCSLPSRRRSPTIF